MKIKILLFIVMSYSAVNVWAADTKIKFGKIDIKDLQMKIYEKDSSASAVVLYDNGKSSIEYDVQSGWGLIFNRHQRIKILRKEGVDYGNFTISLNIGASDSEVLTGFKAVTYNLENGKIVKDELGFKDIHTEEVNEYWEQKIFTLPNVKVGSVLEIKYTIDCKKYFRNMRPWKFQRAIPVKFSEYSVVIPEYFNFRKFALGYEEFTLSEETESTTSIQSSSAVRSGGSGYNPVKTSVQYESSSYRNTIYHWIIEDVPSFEKEAYISTEDNYIQQVQFELESIKFPNSAFHSYSESWESINTKLIEDFDFGEVIFASNNFLNEELTPLIEKCESDLEKLRIIYEHVRDNYKFNDRYSIYSQGLRKVQKEKSGNIADINFLLAAMLSNAGFNAKPVILSTRNNGIYIFPTVTGFNYVIVQCEVDGEKVLLDASDKNCGINQIPFRCLNGQGLIVGGSHPEWINLQDQGRSFIQQVAQLEIGEDGSLKGMVNSIRDGYSALAMREKVRRSSSVEKYLEEYAESHPDWEIEDCQIENIDDTNKKVVQKMSLLINNAIVTGNDRIYLSPIVFNPEKSNPFKLKERKYPVDFGYKLLDRQTYIFTIPEGYIVEELPKSANVFLPDDKAKFIINYRMIDNAIQIYNSIEINTPVFLPADYEYLKILYNNIIEKHNEQIILKKV